MTPRSSQGQEQEHEELRSLMQAALDASLFAATGLGLATSHAIITQAGGRLVLQSELGHGTRAEVLGLCAP